MPRPLAHQWKCQVIGGTQDGHKFGLDEPLIHFSDDVAGIETTYGVYHLCKDHKEVVYMPVDWIERNQRGLFQFPLEMNDH